MAKNDKYKELSEKIIDLIGGKDNVSFFTHCITRLRFNIKDRGLVQLPEIEKLPGVIGAQWSGEQLQIIIGQSVGDVYRKICEEHGFTQEDEVAADIEEKKAWSVKGVISGMLDGIVGSITPIIPMMIGAGILKAVAMIVNIAGILPTDSSTYQVLMWVGDGFIYFLPVFLGATAARKFGINQGLGMLMGAVLIHPNFIAAVTEGTKMTIFGLPIYMTNYANSVIPVIMSVYLMSKLERVFNKYCPDLFKSFLVPTLTIAIMLPIMLVIIAPLGFYIGTYVTAGIIWLYEAIGFLGVSVLAALFPLLVMTGMHTTMTSYWIPAISTLGFEPFYLPANFVSNMTQAAACFGVALKTKDKNVKSTAFSCALTALIGGVTEPALFGITLKYKKPLYAAMIGNLVGGLIIGLTKVVCYVIPGSGGIFGFVTFFSNEHASNFVWFMISIVVSMVITFVLTLILGIGEEKTA